MTSIDKSTITLPKAAAAMIVVAGFIAQYYTTQNAVKEGFNEFKRETDLKVRDLENEDKLIRQEIRGVQSKVEDIQAGITSYIGKAIIPESPKLQEEKRR
jgi:peptidoglycan hydrolase CwlO-like protein